MANKKDIIVLAGKGHETYQEINGEKYPFDEREIVNQIIKENIKCIPNKDINVSICYSICNILIVIPILKRSKSRAK